MASSLKSDQPQHRENGEKAQGLYDLIRHTANQFLHNCSTFPIEVLAKENPTYADIADAISKLVPLIALLASDFDPMIGQKAFEYCHLMKQMGVAITKHDQVELSKLVEELKRKPGL